MLINLCKNIKILKGKSSLNQFWNLELDVLAVMSHPFPIISRQFSQAHKVVGQHRRQVYGSNKRWQPAEEMTLTLVDNTAAAHSSLASEHFIIEILPMTRPARGWPQTRRCDLYLLCRQVRPASAVIGRAPGRDTEQHGRGPATEQLSKRGPAVQTCTNWLQTHSSGAG